MPKNSDIVDRTKARLIEHYGNPIHDTVKILCWNLADGLDLVFQLDVKVRFAALWVTYSDQENYPSDIATIYPAGEGRHSNPYSEHTPSLVKEKSAVKLRIRDGSQLNEVIQWLDTWRQRLHAASR